MLNKMNRRKWLAGIAVAALTPVLFLAGCGGDDDDNGGIGNPLVFLVSLTAGQEIPAPQGNPTATGTAQVSVSEDGSTITAVINTTVTGFTSDVTAGHIHIITNPNGTGPVVFPLFNRTTDGAWTGHVTRTFTAADFPVGGFPGIPTFADAVAQIRAGNGYVNFHTVLNPAGEIRGDLEIHNQG
jgi:hypothetical protein